MLGSITLGAFLFWSAVMAAVVVCFGGTLMALNRPKESGEQGESVQSKLWNDHSTQQEGLARTRAYGKNLHHGNIVGKWTDVVDHREVLYLMLDHGGGPAKGVVSPIADNVFLNDQPAANFTSVGIQERLGTMNQTCMTGFEKPKLEYNLKDTELRNGADVTLFTTPNDFFDDIEYTIMFPNGLRYQHKSGGFDSIAVTLQVRIREVGGGWTDISPAPISANTTEARFYNFKVSDDYVITRGTQYELEFAKLSGDSQQRVMTDVYLRSVREVIETPFTKPGRVLVGIRAIATAQLSGSIDVKVIREDRILNVYNSVTKTWTLEYSNNRGWVAWDAATLPVISGDGDGTPYAIEFYEGISPNNLDLEFFSKWAAFCEEEIIDGYGGTEERCPCNTKIEAFTNVFKWIKDIAAVGRASVYIAGHRLTGWIDDEVATRIDLVTMDTLMHKTWKNSWVIPDELVGVVEVFYQDEKIGFERTPAEYGNTDAGGYQNITTLEGIGLISRGTAVHYAAYLLERNHLIRNRNTFRVHKVGFRYKLGDVIRLQCRMSNWGIAFRVKSSTADTVTVDRIASAEVSIGDSLYIRSYNTVLKQVETRTYVVDSVVGKVITVTVNWEVTPLKGNVLATGDIKLRRIVKKTSTVDNYFDVEVETYDVTLFDADLIDPDNPNANYIWPTPVSPLSAPITRAEMGEYVTQMIPAPPDIDIPWPSNITWNDDTPEAGHISWSQTDADDDMTFRLKGTTHIIAAGSTDKEFIYWDSENPNVFTATNVFPTAAIITGSWLMCRNLEGVAYPATPIQLLHAAVIMAGTIFADKFYDEDGLIVGVKTDTWAWVTTPGGGWGKSLGTSSDREILYNVKQFLAEAAGQQWKVRLRTKWEQAYHQGHYGAIRPELWVGGVQKWVGDYHSSYNAWKIFEWGPITLSDEGISEGDTVDAKVRIKNDLASPAQQITCYSRGYPGDAVTTQSPFGELLKE